jgi:hypothetical protein
VCRDGSSPTRTTQTRATNRYARTILPYIMVPRYKLDLAEPETLNADIEARRREKEERLLEARNAQEVEKFKACLL